jgi:KaiC/GvpD/RAD55 family RecA-like ATPase
MNQRLPKFLNVIPCAGKVPLVKWTEYTDRLATEAERAQWEKQFPDSGTGIVCGPVSKTFVLDVDGAKGRASIADKEIPKTWRVATPRDGDHYYFQWVPELENRITTKAGVFEGVDVRGQGGFVAFYGWKIAPQTVPLAKPPQWLIDALPLRDGAKVAAPAAPTGWLTNQLSGIKEGNRNQTFTAIAGSLRARDYREEEIFELLKPRAKECGFPESELRTICQSVMRYAPRVAAPSTALAPPLEEDDDTSLKSFMKVMEKPEYIVEPMLAKKKIGFFAGLPETGKTFMLMDLAIEVAREGGLWLGKFPVAERLKVFYIDQERDKSETQRRFDALLNGKDLTFDDLEGWLEIRGASANGPNTKLDLQHSLDAFKRKLTKLKPALVIIDSFATFHTKEESNRKEIQAVMEIVKQLRVEFSCTLLFVHHETKMAYQQGKEGRAPNYLDMAGNVAIPAAAETVFNVKVEDSASSMVHHTKSTIGKKVAPFLVRIIDLDDSKTRIRVEAI